MKKLGMCLFWQSIGSRVGYPSDLNHYYLEFGTGTQRCNFGVTSVVFCYVIGVATIAVLA